jgi:mRNA-degrading endonuclease RelE of RelBE toxin-antitoxin system
MPYWLELSADVRRQIERLPGHLRQRVKRIIASLRHNPRPKQSIELCDRSGRYRIRLDDHWRIFYRIDDRQLIVTILRVGRKKGPEFYDE